MVGWEQEEAGPVAQEVSDWLGGTSDRLHGLMLVF